MFISKLHVGRLAKVGYIFIKESQTLGRKKSLFVEVLWNTFCTFPVMDFLLDFFVDEIFS